jgi:hypothetical protein
MTSIKWFHEDKAERLRRAAEALRSGEDMPEWIKDEVASGLERAADRKSNPFKLGNGVGRPSGHLDDWSHWVAWFAAYCDPEFNELPRTAVTGRWAVIVERVPMSIGSEAQVRNLANEYRLAPRATELLDTIQYCDRYAKLRGWEFDQSVLDRMIEWHRAARKHLVRPDIEGK